MSSINYPFITEKAMILLEENKLQFIVDTRSNKKQIVEDVEKLYGFKVKSVRTMTTMKGTKKAVMTFEDPESAHEIAT
ncbi:MAG: 50S ribosomal protein L23, partial [Methanosarcina sp.]|nr:50S ribosomal protein L23 [Methanosarcina sp.]